MSKLSALYIVRPVIGAPREQRTRYQELLGRCLVTLFNTVEVWRELPAALTTLAPFDTGDVDEAA